jgi:hypothetical protein
MFRLVPVKHRNIPHKKVTVTRRIKGEIGEKTYYLFRQFLQYLRILGAVHRCRSDSLKIGGTYLQGIKIVDRNQIFVGPELILYGLGTKY